MINFYPDNLRSQEDSKTLSSWVLCYTHSTRWPSALETLQLLSKKETIATKKSKININALQSDDSQFKQQATCLYLSTGGQKIFQWCNFKTILIQTVWQTPELTGHSLNSTSKMAQIREGIHLSSSLCQRDTSLLSFTVLHDGIRKGQRGNEWRSRQLSPVI